MTLSLNNATDGGIGGCDVTITMCSARRWEGANHERRTRLGHPDVSLHVLELFSVSHQLPALLRLLPHLEAVRGAAARRRTRSHPVRPCSSPRHQAGFSRPGHLVRRVGAAGWWVTSIGQSRAVALAGRLVALGLSLPSRLARSVGAKTCSVGRRARGCHAERVTSDSRVERPGALCCRWSARGCAVG